MTPALRLFLLRMFVIIMLGIASFFDYKLSKTKDELIHGLREHIRLLEHGRKEI